MADNNEEILINLKIETDLAKAALNKTEVEIKKTIQSFRGLEKGSLDYQAAQAKLANQQAILAKNTIKYNNALKNQSAAQSIAIKGTNQLKNSSGAASSAAMELGRVISDAPYGIRGMANNITQLVSQLGYATTAAGGFGAAMKQMWSALMGPLGIVLAITSVVSALDFFAGGQKKATEATSKFSNLVDKQASKLLLLKDIMKDSNVSLDDKKKIISDVNEEFKGLNLTIDKQGKLTKTSQKNIDKLTESLVKNAKAQAVLERITKEQSKIVEIEIERSKRIAEGGVGAFKGTLEDLEEQRKKYIDRHKKQIDNSNLSEIQKKEALDKYMKSSSMKRFDALANFRSKDIEDAKNRIKELQKMITGESLFSIFKDEGKDNESGVVKLSPFKTPKELDIDIKNADNAIIQYNKKLKDARLKKELNDKLSEAKTEQEKAQIRKEYEKKNLINQLNAEEEVLKLKKSTEEAVVKTKVKNHVDELKRKHKEFITELDNKEKLKKISKKDSDALKSEATVKLLENAYKAESEQTKSLKEIEDKYKPLFELFEKLGLARVNALAGDEDKQATTLEKIEVYIDAYKTLMGGVTQFLNGEFDRQLTIEENKTNSLNAELNNRLNNENLSKDQRASIQNEIARNDEKLRLKQDAINRKKFNQQKAFNISMAVIDTYSAGVKVLADPSFIGRPFARVIAMTATIASGLAQVAAISKQKFQSSSANTPINTGGGGSSSSGERAEPTFNIVGSATNSAVVDAIQSRFDQPLKAYVVSREITSQQEMDTQILDIAGT